MARILDEDICALTDAEKEAWADHELARRTQDKDYPFYSHAQELRRIRDGERRILDAAQAGYVPPSATDSALCDLLLRTIMDAAARKRLPVTVVKMLRLRWEGYTVEEIADKVGRPFETVRMLLKGGAKSIQADPLFGLYEVLAEIFHVSPGLIARLLRK